MTYDLGELKNESFALQIIHLKRILGKVNKIYRAIEVTIIFGIDTTTGFVVIEVSLKIVSIPILTNYTKLDYQFADSREDK